MWWPAQHLQAPRTDLIINDRRHYLDAAAAQWQGAEMAAAVVAVELPLDSDESRLGILGSENKNKI